MRNPLNSVIFFGLLFLCGTVLSAQNGQFGIRFALKNLDCANNKASMQVQIKAQDADHTFLMGDANLYFDYDPSIIRNPVLESQENFSNQAPANDFNYNPQALSNTVTSSTLGTLTLTTLYGGGGFGAKRVGTDWATIATVRFDVLNPSECIALFWHGVDRLPNSIITEIELTNPTPDGNYNQYFITDGTSDNFSQCIPPICRNVVATDDRDSVKINTISRGSAATNDVSNGGAMTFTALGTGTDGSWILESNGNYTYTPTTGFIGTASQVYQVCNTAGLCDTATIYILVFPSTNKPPVITKTPKIVQEDAQTLLCVPFSDPDAGDSHTTIACGTRGGSITTPTNESGQICFYYTSVPDFNGTDTVCLIVCDAEGLCDTAQIPVIVTSMPDAPTLVDALPTTISEDSTMNVCSTIRDVDTPEGPFTFSTCSTPFGGTVTPSVNGNEWCINYTPVPDFTGLDTICLVVCDQTGLCYTLNKVITVTPKPDAPVVSQNPKTTAEDTQVTICQMITDVDAGSTFSTTVCQQPNHGLVTLQEPSVNGGQVCLNYSPSTHYNGLDTVCLIVCDNTGLCDTAFIPITITPVNDKPTIHFTPVTVAEDSIITYCATVIDPDLGDSFSASIGQLPKHGSATAPSVSDNQICVSYTPMADYFGVDTLGLIVCDAMGLCDTVKIPITVLPRNDTPIVTEIPLTTSENTAVSFCQTISDADNRALGSNNFTATLCGQPLHGSVSYPSVTDNRVCSIYTPAPNYNGLDTVCLIVCDETGLCDTAKIRITTTSVSTKPIIHFEPVVLAEDSTISVCATFTDVDGGNVFTAHLCQQPNHGTAAEDIAVNGNQICTIYTPFLNYNGKDTLCLVVCDETNLCDTAKIPMTILPRPDAPNVQITPIVTAEEETIQACYAILDPDAGDVFTASLCYQPVNGTASTPVVKDNKFCFDYAPNINFFGQDTVCLIVCDQTGLCKTIKIPVTVTSVADKPRIVNIFPTSLQEDESFAICSTIVDPDTPEGPFSFQVCKLPIGILPPSVSGNQLCLNYTPKVNYFGKDTICITVCDNTGLCDVLNQVITITSVNDKPSVRDSFATTIPARTVTTCLPISDADVADTHLAFLCENAQHGSVNVQITDRNLCVSYTPSSLFVGQDSVCFIVCDNGEPFLCDTVKMFYEVLTTNSPPVATDDFNAALSGRTTTGDVLTNDSDLNAGQILTPSVIKPPKYASTFTLNSNGSYTFTPTNGFSGTDTISYKVCDNGVPSMCDTAFLVMKIRSFAPFGNQRPVAYNDITSTPSGQPITINVKSNDFDPNPADILGLPTLIGQPSCGTAVVNNINGKVTYTPAPNFVGNCHISYSVCDNAVPSLCDTATLQVTVYPNPFINNQAPNAADDAVATTVNRAVTSNVATNDNDFDTGQILSFSSISTPLHGVVALQTTGVYTYTPATNFVGDDAFLYKVCDNGFSVLCDTARVFVHISNPIVVNNLPPVANPDNPVTTAGIAITIFAKANDYDPNGDPLSMPTILGQPNGGNVVVNADGTLYFTPNLGFSGNTSFIYQVCDNQTPSLCDTALVTILVKPIPTPANRAPVAINDAFIATANAPLSNQSIGTNDSDPDGLQTLSFMQLSSPTRGLMSFNSGLGTFTFLPQANFVGVDSFRYKVCDNGTPSLCDTAWVYVTYINPPTANLPPVAMDDATETLMNTSLRIPILSNDKDPNNDPFSNPTILGQLTCGTATINRSGIIDFVPTTDFVGTCTFAYKVCDSGGLCDTATVTVKVNALPRPDNQSPIAQNDATTTPINTPVSNSVAINDSDPDAGQQLVFTPSINPANGSVTMQTTGQYIYTPNTGFVGRDIFTYQVCDNGSPVLCATASVTIDVTAAGVNVNVAPTAFDDKATVITGVLANIAIKANDYDLNTNQVLGLPSIVTLPSCGTASVNADGTIAFKSNAGFMGVCSLTYRVCDNGSPVLCDTATVEITVKPVPTVNIVNIAPVAVDDASSNFKNTVQRGHVEDNDTDANLTQIMTFSLVNQPAHGAVLLSSTGAYLYRPDSNYVGTDHFTYQICDNGSPSLCDTATVYLTIFDNPCITFNLKAWLEGAYNPITGKMRTTLNQRGLLPGQTPVGEYAVKTKIGQPYNTAPWNYAGTEGDTMTVYPPTVVDWVLVSLRSNASSINPVWRSAALLHEDGTISFPNGCIELPMGSYFVLIEHRNHLGIMSPIAVSTVMGTIDFNFTLSDAYIVTDPPSFGQKRLSNGQWVMFSGDGMKTTTSNNFDINTLDAQLWNGQSGLFDRYIRGDFNLDADINTKDQILWKGNSGRYSGVPH